MKKPKGKRFKPVPTNIKPIRAKDLMARRAAVDRLARELLKRANQGQSINGKTLKAFSTILERILRGEPVKGLSREEIEKVIERFKQFFKEEKEKL
jgi:phosphoserine phosphatase